MTAALAGTDAELTALLIRRPRRHYPTTEREIANFIARGGRVTICPPGADALQLHRAGPRQTLKARWDEAKAARAVYRSVSC